jgi:hypothetical protein
MSAERVGPVLESSEVGQAIVRAIRHENADVRVDDRGAYLRVGVPGVCRVSRVAIEREIGRAFRLPGDLESVMPAFSGGLTIGEDGAIWEWTDR